MQMKVLMVSDDHNDKVLAVLALKNLNAANSIDFVSNVDELMDYISIRANCKDDLPNLVLVSLDTNRRDAQLKIRTNSKLTGLNIISFAILQVSDVAGHVTNVSKTDELDWILKEICDSLVTRDGWQYRIESTLSTAHA